MEVGQLYQFIIIVVLVGVVLATGIIVLDKFSQVPGLSATANTSIQGTITALTPISSSWLPVIVIVAVMAIIIGMIVRSFSVQGR